MDWTRAYTCRISVHRVDPRTWADMDEVQGVMTASVTRGCTEKVPLIETGDMTVDGPLQSGYYRISAITTQGSVERHDIATLLFDDVVPTYNKGETLTASGYSVLKPADDMAMVLGSYIPKGSDGAQQAALLLRKCISAPVDVQGGFILTNNVVFPNRTTYLAAAWALLNAGNHCIQIAGDGTVTIMPKPTEPSIVLDKDNAGILLPEVRPDSPTSGVPNRYYVVGGTSVVMAVNDNPESAVSYQSRGRWVDHVDKSPIRINGESLQGYAERKLREMTKATRKVSYTREYEEGIVPFSIVRGNLPEWGLDGDMMVASQSLDLTHGIKVQETCLQEVSL